MTALVDIAPDYVRPNPNNPRRDLGPPDELERLADSIRAVGIKQPLLVRPVEKVRGHQHYELIIGHRRLAAAKLAGRVTVPCIVEEHSLEHQAEIMLIENLQRVDLAPLEEATSFQRLVDEFTWSQDRLAERIGRSQSHVSKRLSLLQLPAKVQKALDSGGMTIGDALELTKLADHPERLLQAFDHGKGGAYGGIAGAVAFQIREQKDEDRIAKLVAQAEKGKAPFVPPTVHRGNGHREVPNGAIALQGYYGTLGLTDAQAKKHADVDCHAVTVVRDYQGARITPICTKPATHRKDAPKLSKRELAEREKQRAIVAATKARRAFFSEHVLPAKVPADRLESLILEEILSASWAEVITSAAKLLGLDPIETVTDYGAYKTTSRNYAQPVRDLAESGAPGRRRVMLAIVAAGAESGMKHDYYGWGPRQIEYVGLLQEHGYELTPDEEKRLEKASPDPEQALDAGDEEPTCRICGCTEDEACEGGCSWVTDPEGLGDLCSRCLEENYAAGELVEAEA